MPDAEVARWLKSAGLSRFIPRFEAANISSTDFLELLPGDFDAFGIDSPADRKRLSDLVTDRRRAASLPRRTSPSRPRIKTEATLAREGEIRERRKEKERARLEKLSGGSKSKQVARVSVCVRKRPLSSKETAKLDRDIIEASSPNSLNVFELKEKVDLTKYVETHNFVFDRVFSDSCDNEDVYQDTAKPLVEALFEGGRSTCFAYGQTGAGKTYTMAGDGYETPGLYSLAVQDLFETIEYRREQAEARRAERSESEDDDDFDADEHLEVWISFFEIYGTRLHDLLGNRAKLECREDTNNEVQIVGLTERKCENDEEVFQAIDEANEFRSTGVTGANDDSSRSHAVFQIELRQAFPDGGLSESSLMRNSILTGCGRSELQEAARKPKEVGRLCFIDLAGSERGSDTANNDKQTRMEGAEINKSLLALKECIRAMGQQKNHTPFRGSKLTQVLKASFIGKNCRTVMIANVSPASSNVEHTLNTLRYSDRVKEIRKDRVGLNPNATFSSTRSLSRAGRPVRRATFAVGINSAKNDTQNDGLTSSMRNRKAMTSTTDDVDSRRQSEKMVRPKLPRGQPIQRPTRRITRAHTRSGRVSPPSSGELPPSAPLSATNSNENVSLSTLREQRGNTRLRGTQSSASLPKRRTMIPSASKSKKGSDSDANSGSGSGSENGPSRRTRLQRRQTSASLARPNTRLRVREAAAKLEAEEAAAAAAVEVIEVEEEELIAKPRNARPLSSSGSISARVIPKEKKTRPKSGGWLPDAVDYFSGADEEAQEDEILFKQAPAPKPSTVRDVQAVAGLSPMRTRSGAIRKSSNEKFEAVTTSTVTEESVSETSAPVQRRDVHSTSMREVIRHHHMQIEELMRLCEMDVQLVKAAESGEMDPADYAIRLDKNLAQKLDAVINLKAMVGWLTSSK